MSGIERCLDEKVQAGVIDRAGAEKALQLVKRLEGDYAARLSQSAAERAAAARAAEILAEQTRQQKRRTALQVLAAERNMAEVRGHGSGAAAGLLSKLTKDRTGQATWENIEYRGRAILAEQHAQFAEPLSAMRARWLGTVRDKVLMEDFVRERWGVDTGNPVAKQAAQAFGAIREWVIERYNKAGGNAQKRRGWDLPHRHDSARIREAAIEDRAAGRTEGETFVDFVWDKLDRARMVDPETGIPLNDLELRAALYAVHENLRTDGLASRAPGSLVGTKALANKWFDHRFLEFKDAEAWLAYDRRFGADDIFGTITETFRSAATDIAAIEVLGPNPDAAFRQLLDIVELERKRAGGAPAKQKAAQVAKAGVTWFNADVNKTTLEATYDVALGRAFVPERELLARNFQGFRNMLTSAMLGSAALASTTDLAFIRQTAAFNGLPMARVIKEATGHLNPRNEADRLTAARAALGADAWVYRSLGAFRSFDEIQGSGITSWFADLTMRLSGLELWTHGWRSSFREAMSGELADQLGRRLDELAPAQRAALERRGIDAAAWDKLRAVPALTIDGARFVDFGALSRHADQATAEAGRSLHRMILEETDYAVPAPDAYVRGRLQGGLRPGTWWGEVVRSVTLFKSYPVTVMSTHLARGLYEVQGGSNKAAYLGTLMVSLISMGALSVQMRQVAMGKDPLDMTDPRFLLAATMQGGGFGLMGDFLYQGLTRHGSSFAETLAGPLFSSIGQAARLNSPVRAMLDGGDSNFGAELVRLAGQYTPVLSSLWYARAAYDRAIIGQLRQWADPRAERALRQQMRRDDRQSNQGYWWDRTSAAPARLPDLGAAIGGSR